MSSSRKTEKCQAQGRWERPLLLQMKGREREGLGAKADTPSWVIYATENKSLSRALLVRLTASECGLWLKQQPAAWLCSPFSVTGLSFLLGTLFLGDTV